MKPISERVVKLVNIIAILLIVLFLLGYLLIAETPQPKQFLSFIKDIIPNLSAGLITYLVVYFFLIKPGLFTEQQFYAEIQKKIEEILTRKYNDFASIQRQEVKQLIRELYDRFFDEQFQIKLLASAKELSEMSLLQKRMENAGISNFYASRVDYAHYRGAPKLIDFLRLATKEIYIASYWMAHGTEIEGVPQKIAELTKEPKRVKITIAILNPNSLCIEALAEYLDMSKEEVSSRIKRALDKLYKVRDSLTDEEKERFIIKVYNTLPIASIIMIDPCEGNGRLQIDLKIYKTERQNSFGFELKNSQYETKALYVLCRDAWLEMINTSPNYTP